MRRNDLITATAVLSFGLTLSGCGTLYKLDVTAFSNPDHELGNSYVILSSNPKVDMNSPEFEEYASQLERALAENDYRRVPGDSLENVALAVYLYADIGEPEKRFHTVRTALVEPAYDETVTRESQSTGGSQGGGGSQGPSRSQTQSVEPPPPEVLTGYEQQQFATTVYEKHLSIQAVNLQRYIRDVQQLGRDNAVPHEVWSVEVETTGRPSDLDEVVPVMIAAAQPFFGVGSFRNVQVKMSESDPRIRYIKGE